VKVGYANVEFGASLTEYGIKPVWTGDKERGSVKLRYADREVQPGTVDVSWERNNPWRTSSEPRVAINWSAVGAVSIRQAASFGSLLVIAGLIASRIEDFYEGGA